MRLHLPLHLSFEQLGLKFGPQTVHTLGDCMAKRLFIQNNHQRARRTSGDNLASHQC